MNQPIECNAFRILVVDDNPSIHEDFRKILCPNRSQNVAQINHMMEELFGDAPASPMGGRFEMDSAFQGQEALAKVQAAEREGRPYSLAFIDVRMPPGWDGVETIARIWKEYPQIQVVICTAYSDYSWEEITRNLGETDSLVILKKPFDNVEALQLAHTLTKKWAVTLKANARMADLDERVRQRTAELEAANQRLHAEIRQRSLVESALRESEERFHKAFETVSLALAIRPLHGGGYLDVNQSFVELTGYARAELLGKSPDQLNLLVDPDGYFDLLQMLPSGRQVRHVELQVRRRTGEVRQTVASVELLRLGTENCLLVALQDVTDQRALENQFRQSQKMEAIGQLAAGIAQDFNNLLTIIHGYSSLYLAKESLDADVANAFTQVKMASDRAASLTRQLLAFSRRQICQRRPLDLSETISGIHKMLSRVVGENIQLECRLAAGLPRISADEANLGQVVLNLAVNARDAMPNGGKLLLATSQATVTAAEASGHPDKREGRFVVLTVTDTGCGMDAATLGRIFEPFFTTKPVGRGTGLGLSTVYGILKQHDGWIEVESEPGRGTTFRAFLPVTALAPESDLEIPPPDAPTEAEIGPEDIIFVVEDEPSVRKFTVAILSAAGYHVEQASNGAEALAKWNHLSNKVRLLLTDMVMPGGVSGMMLAKQLLRRNQDLRVIYTSGYSPDVIANGSVLHEGANFLAKPFTRDNLLATVRTALASRSFSTELMATNPEQHGA